MKTHCKQLATVLAALLAIPILAAVPLEWTVRPGQPAPVTFDRYHGETLHLFVTFQGFGALPFDPGADVRLWYQTNGMENSWWSAPATVSSNVLSATWSPELDPGAERVALFFGAPSNAYAAAVLRLRHSPGFTPATPPPPSAFVESDPVFAAWVASNNVMSVVERKVSRSGDTMTGTLGIAATATYPRPHLMWARPPQIGDVEYSNTTYGADGIGRTKYTVTGVNELEITSRSKSNGGGDLFFPDGTGTLALREDIPSTNGFLSVESDPTVPDWAKEPEKPEYTPAEIGAATHGDATNAAEAVVARAAVSATNYTDRSISSFAATGTVFRSASYGTPTRWTDATGCVWEVVTDAWIDHKTGNIFRNGISIFPGEEADGEMRGYLQYDPDAMGYLGSEGEGWYYNGSNTSGTPADVLPGGPDATSLDNGRFTLGFTNLVGRVALTNDIPSTNALSDTVARAVYDVHDLKWDEEESILYWCKMVGGHDLCIAVTNVDLTHPTNAAALKVWREANR